MLDPEIKLLQGNQACAFGALAAGVNFYAGYPITPSTEIAEILSSELPKRGGTYIQMEDEIASMSAVLGASLTGAKAMTATSGPGFSLMQEALGYGIMAEVPALLVNVQRAGPSTGLPTAPSQGDVMQARWGTHGDHPIIVLSPASVTEAYELSKLGVELSQKYSQPVILLMDEVVGHMRESVNLTVSNDRITAQSKKMHISQLKSNIPFGQGAKYHVTGLVHDETGFPTGKQPEVEKAMTRLLDKQKIFEEEACFSQSTNCQDADVVIVAYGCTARSAMRAIKDLAKEGYKVGLFRPITIWPFPKQDLLKAVGSCAKILIPELNSGQLRLEVERHMRSQEVIGLNRTDGELITPQHIMTKVKEVLK
ncbi:MAG: 2-oxoacid:acceptor oxidoreductase subunit alpha [Bacillota bacterium]|nr:2-oxoacid:acceptor oxidoreductase subunit alpha [Bacillota bacterium]